MLYGSISTKHPPQAHPQTGQVRSRLGLRGWRWLLRVRGLLTVMEMFQSGLWQTYTDRGTERSGRGECMARGDTSGKRRQEAKPGLRVRPATTAQRPPPGLAALSRGSARLSWAPGPCRGLSRMVTASFPQALGLWAWSVALG